MYIIKKLMNTQEKTLTLDSATARSLYPTASAEFKILLEKNFTKEFFSRNYRDFIKSWKDVCAETGKDPILSLPYPNANKNANDTEEYNDQEAANAHWRITQTIKLFKKGQKCNYEPNNNQYKYYAWMEYQESLSGVGFSNTYSVYDDTVTNVGPRLCSLVKEDAIHIASVVCKQDYETYFNEK